MKNYLLTAATAFALGAGTTQLADLDAHASKAMDHREVVTLTVSNANATVAGIWTSVRNATCALADTAAGFDAGTCAIQVGTVVSLTRGEADTQVSVSHVYPGTFVAGAAQ